MVFYILFACYLFQMMTYSVNSVKLKMVNLNQLTSVLPIHLTKLHYPTQNKMLLLKGCQPVIIVFPTRLVIFLHIQEFLMSKFMGAREEIVVSRI